MYIFAPHPHHTHKRKFLALSLILNAASAQNLRSSSTLLLLQDTFTTSHVLCLCFPKRNNKTHIALTAAAGDPCAVTFVIDFSYFEKKNITIAQSIELPRVSRSIHACVWKDT